MDAYETVINSLYQAADWSREGVLQEVLEWLDENFYDKLDMIDYSFVITGLNSNFNSKEEMLQSFKERFNIE